MSSKEEILKMLEYLKLYPSRTTKKSRLHLVHTFII